MYKSLFSFLFSAVLLLGSATAGAASTTAPDALARGVTDEVMQILRTDKDLQSGSQKKARELIVKQEVRLLVAAPCNPRIDGVEA